VVPITHEEIIICSKTRLDSTAHEQAIICRQLFAGHVVGCRPMEGKKNLHRMINIPNRTFLVRFGGISGEFGRAMVRILARRSRAKIPMARPNEHDMQPKRTKKYD